MTTDGGGGGLKDYSEKSTTLERRYTPGGYGGGGGGGYMEEEGSGDIFSNITESRIMAASHKQKVSKGFSEKDLELNKKVISNRENRLSI
jgi:hypothetical protein